jgi:hypothetical protein
VLRPTVLLLAIVAGCEPSAQEAPPPAARAWVVPPPPAAWLLGRARGSIGRTVAPQVVLQSGVTDEAVAVDTSLRFEQVTPRSALVYDANGVRAYVAFAMESATLTHDAIIGRRGQDVRRFPLPERWHGRLDIVKPMPVAPPAELRDLPALETVAGTTIALPGMTNTSDLDIYINGWVLFAGDARIDLRRREKLLVDVACEHESFALCRAGDRARVRADGKYAGTIASDDGGDVIADILQDHGMDLVIAAERGRVVARLPSAQMVPAWSLDVRGVVASIETSGDAVLVTLEDGDAYRIDARTGEATALAGSGLAWRVAGDVFTGITAGGFVPPADPIPPPPPPKPREAPLGDQDTPPRLMTPVAPPPNLAASVQLTLYAHDGSLRARNDYAIPLPATAGARYASAPIVVMGGDQLLVVDPVHGDPLRRIHLPADALPGTAFSTVLDAGPVVGVLAANPMRVVLF